MIFSSNLVNSQIPNDLAIKSLFRKFLALDQGEFSAIEGYLLEGSREIFVPDEDAHEILRISAPDVAYDRLGKNAYQRQLAIDFSYVDTVAEKSRDFHVELLDTLSRKEVRTSRDIPQKELKGDSPFFLTKFIIPAAATLAGISGIISLFYLRS